MVVDQRLPIVNSDDGTWGEILRQYLLKEHYDTGADNAANGGHQRITIRPGTATAGTAPIKFTTGTLMTTAEAGAMEFVGDFFYLTQTSGTARRRIATYEDTGGATGDLYYRNATGYFTRLPLGSNGNVLVVNGTVPSWSSSAAAGTAATLATGRTIQTDLSSVAAPTFDGSANITPGITGTLPVSHGGTGTTSLSTGRFVVGNGTTAVTTTKVVPAGDVIGTTDAQALSNKDMTAGTNTWPTFNQDTTGTASNVTGTVAIANGGTGATTQQTALNALTVPAGKSGNYLRSNGTNTLFSAIQAGDVPTLNQNTTGSAASLTTSRSLQVALGSASAQAFNGTANATSIGVSGVLPVSYGGTGTTTFTSGNYLTGNGTGAISSVASIPVADLGTGKVTGSTNGTTATKILWTGTQAQYNAIGTKDSNTVYIIT